MNILRTLQKTHSYNSYKEAYQFAKTIPDETWNKMSQLLFSKDASLLSSDRRICPISKNIISEKQLFYHGEQIDKKIKNYILDEDRILCDELGDGLYVSPSKKVAAFWAGVNGKIFKLKLNTNRIAQVNQEQIETMVNVIADNVKGFVSNPTGQRLNIIIRMLFQKNGYDAAYASQSLSNGFENAAKFYDAIIGEPQQQLAVYNTNVIEVLPKSFIEKVFNQLLQCKSRIQYYTNLLKYYKDK